MVQGDVPLLTGDPEQAVVELPPFLDVVQFTVPVGVGPPGIPPSATAKVVDPFPGAVGVIASVGVAGATTTWVEVLLLWA
jgi:hypothetical protein